MSTQTRPAAPTTTSPDEESIDLRDPWLAALLGWLVPGLGHIYQRRWGKGWLFMVCILGTFFYGLWLGGGRVVYASFREASIGDRRWAFVPQLGVGLPTVPALVQAVRMGGPNPKAPLWDGFMAPPMLRGEIVPRLWIEQQRDKHPDNREYAPSNFQSYKDRDYLQYLPDGGLDANNDQFAEWHYRLGSRFDLGTAFTMIAGLLNILAIWDAFGGPVPPPKTEEESKD